MIRFLGILRWCLREWTPKADPTAGHFRWMCAGCGAGGMKPDERAARSDADAHAASHDFEHRYGLEAAGEWRH